MNNLNDTLITEITDKNDKLRDFIYNLSYRNIEIDVNKEKENLKCIYTPLKSSNQNYRHLYSKIFTYLIEIKKDEDENIGIDALSENLAFLYKSLLSDKANGNLDDDLYNCFVKLYDHLNLEIARINYTGTLVFDSAENINKKVSQSRTEMRNISNDIKESKKQLSDIQKDYVSILGIFASIVLAFNGAMSFGSNMLSNINSASIYRIIFVCCLLGIVFNSLICVLTNFINKIWKGIEKSDYLYFVTNGILLAIMLVDAIVFFIDKY